MLKKSLAAMTRRWSEIHNLADPALAEIRLPSSRTKTGSGHWIPLSDEARRILKSVPRASHDYVFPGAGGKLPGQVPFDDWHRLKADIDAAVGEPAFAMGYSRPEAKFGDDSGRPALQHEPLCRGQIAWTYDEA